MNCRKKAQESQKRVVSGASGFAELRPSQGYGPTSRRDKPEGILIWQSFFAGCQPGRGAVGMKRWRRIFIRRYGQVAFVPHAYYLIIGSNFCQAPANKNPKRQGDPDPASGEPGREKHGETGGRSFSTCPAVGKAYELRRQHEKNEGIKWGGKEKASARKSKPSRIWVLPGLPKKRFWTGVSSCRPIPYSAFRA
jgi:hypothetical protein